MYTDRTVLMQRYTLYFVRYVTRFFRREYICCLLAFPWHSDRCLPRPIAFIGFSLEAEAALSRTRYDMIERTVDI